MISLPSEELYSAHQPFRWSTWMICRTRHYRHLKEYTKTPSWTNSSTVSLQQTWLPFYASNLWFVILWCKVSFLTTLHFLQPAEGLLWSNKSHLNSHSPLFLYFLANCFILTVKTVKFFFMALYCPLELNAFLCTL